MTLYEEIVREVLNEETFDIVSLVTAIEAFKEFYSNNGYNSFNSGWNRLENKTISAKYVYDNPYIVMNHPLFVNPKNSKPYPNAKRLYKEIMEKLKSATESTSHTRGTQADIDRLMGDKKVKSKEEKKIDASFNDTEAPRGWNTIEQNYDEGTTSERLVYKGLIQGIVNSENAERNIVNMDNDAYGDEEEYIAEGRKAKSTAKASFKELLNNVYFKGRRYEVLSFEDKNAEARNDRHLQAHTPKMSANIIYLIDFDERVRQQKIASLSDDVQRFILEGGYSKLTPTQSDDIPSEPDPTFGASRWSFIYDGWGGSDINLRQQNRIPLDTSKKNIGMCVSDNGLVARYKVGEDGQPIVDENYEPIPLLEKGTKCITRKLKDNTNDYRIIAQSSFFPQLERWYNIYTKSFEQGVTFTEHRGEICFDVNGKIVSNPSVDHLSGTHSKYGVTDLVLMTASDNSAKAAIKWAIQIDVTINPWVYEKALNVTENTPFTITGINRQLYVKQGHLYWVDNNQEIIAPRSSKDLYQLWVSIMFNNGRMSIKAEANDTIENIRVLVDNAEISNKDVFVSKAKWINSKECDFNMVTTVALKNEETVGPENMSITLYEIPVVLRERRGLDYHYTHWVPSLKLAGEKLNKRPEFILQLMGSGPVKYMTNEHYELCNTFSLDDWLNNGLMLESRASINTKYVPFTDANSTSLSYDSLKQAATETGMKPTPLLIPNIISNIHSLIKNTKYVPEPQNLIMKSGYYILKFFNEAYFKPESISRDEKWKPLLYFSINEDTGKMGIYITKPQGEVGYMECSNYGRVRTYRGEGKYSISRDNTTNVGYPTMNATVLELTQDRNATFECIRKALECKFDGSDDFAGFNIREEKLALSRHIIAASTWVKIDSLLYDENGKPLTGIIGHTGHIVHHADSNTTNYAPENLFWVTKINNTAYDAENCIALFYKRALEAEETCKAAWVYSDPTKCTFDGQYLILHSPDMQLSYTPDLIKRCMQFSDEVEKDNTLSVGLTEEMYFFRRVLIKDVPNMAQLPPEELAKYVMATYNDDGNTIKYISVDDNSTVTITGQAHLDNDSEDIMSKKKLRHQQDDFYGDYQMMAENIKNLMDRMGMRLDD